MTINADFFKLIKEGCAQAFSNEAPKRPDVVFIDGQVKLMKAAQVDTWSVFFAVQFFKTIENGFALGASTVVLAFDDYKHVPASKTMTQVKRAKQKIVFPFAQTACLPSKMPEDWASAMANRSFKVKVISKVLEATTLWFKKKLTTDPAYKERNLVLDYAGVPQLLRLEIPDSAPNKVANFISQHDWTPKTDTVGRGECDIKAFVWMHISSCLCIISTDGDYLPLALLQTCSNECDVVLFRMTTQIADTASMKRKMTAAEENSTSDATNQHKTSRRTYEYVRIGPIACWIKQVLPSKAIDPVRQFCAMVALCGCDFARNLPRLGPRTLWKLRHRLQHTDLLQTPQIVSALSIAYTELFVMKNAMPAGIRNNMQWFQDTSDDQVCVIYNQVAARIQANSKVSPRIKLQLWGADIAIAHARNTVWTLHYWSFLDNCPDPHASDFGYVRDAKGRTHFAANNLLVAE
jgi:hypothetical protein